MFLFLGEVYMDLLNVLLYLELQMIFVSYYLGLAHMMCLTDAVQFGSITIVKLALWLDFMDWFDMVFHEETFLFRIFIQMLENRSMIVVISYHHERVGSVDLNIMK